jgi:hypothetical protein
MDYEVFQSLSADEAQKCLDHFREAGQKGVDELRPLAAENGCDMDYSLRSLPDFLKWMVKSVSGYRVPISDEVPWWVSQAHPEGAFEFNEASKTSMVRSAYYLGECFARLPGLRWATGDVEYMEKICPSSQAFDMNWSCRRSS